MIKPGQILLAILIFSAALVACEQERDPCLEPRTVSTNVVIKKAIESDTGVIVSDSALPRAIIGVPDSPAFFIGQNGRNLQNFAFVLSPLADSTSLYIIPDSTKQTSKFDIDTITFYYKRRLAFISTPCGYTYHYFLTNLRHTTNNIDSATITAQDVNGNVNVQHVKIYY